MHNPRSKFLWIAAVCSMVAPLLLLGSDLFRYATGRDFEWTLGLWFAFLLFIPAVIGFTYLLVSSGSRLALLGGASAFFGAMAGASMQVLFRVHAVLAEQGDIQTVERLRASFKLVATTQMIGLTWPLGLILLSISLLLLDRSRWLTSLLLTAGAIAFPIGRIAGSPAAVVISGVFFVGAFGLIAKHLSSEVELPA